LATPHAKYAVLRFGLVESNPGFSLTPLVDVQLNARLRKTLGGGNGSEISETAPEKKQAIAYGALPDTDLAMHAMSRRPLISCAVWQIPWNEK
jgi:hypothetical protein